ncbi:arsenate reductase family protein [Peribacillus saganii]|uniref:Arsenate reductase family protein n=1 Tax=Peribacillus saganii TaxID=2303992 RepID=A0A372LPN9_9BACI|nr:arsenate reductase family protein [Peribacillus saganii]RFU70079.1 arsenate reductase family protein [Peribacillus saganii]
MTVTFYWYPKCGSCRNAKKWLDSHNIKYEPVHIAENPPARQQIEELYKKSGLDIKKFFNTSGQKYRELGLKDRIKDASIGELLDILSTDGMLLKRPIVTDGSSVTVGFKEDEFSEKWL